MLPTMARLPIVPASLVILLLVLTPRSGFGEPRANTKDKTSRAQRLMEQGAEQVETGKRLVLASTRSIQLGSQLTRNANRLRFLAKKSGATETDLQKVAGEIATRAAALKEQGADLRKNGESLKAIGLSTMRLGFSEHFRLQPQDIYPISLAQNSPQEGALPNKAHNSVFRTIKSSQNEAESAKKRPKSLTIGNQNPSQQIPDGLDAHPLQLSAKGQYFAYIQSASPVSLNQIHKWHLVLTNDRGEPAIGKKIIVEGIMPGHVHGMPTKPRVIEEVEPGRYVVGGMKFQMAGWWVITFVIDDKPSEQDRVTYNILL